MLDGKVILVTGASRGIGAATARVLAAEGAMVAVNYLKNAEAAETVVRQIRVDGGRAIAVQADVTVCTETVRMVGEVERQLGPIDTLVSNAAIGFKVASFLDYEWKDFEQKLTNELKAAFFCTKAVLPSMLDRGTGNLIYISSVLSRKPGEGFCAHSTAKAGLDGLARALALELGPKGIRVNVVAPGLTLTDATAFIPDQAKQAAAQFTPLRRNGLPMDVAGAVAMLASDYSRFVTSNYVSVDGGVFAH